ncbi:MAG: hypothetical protein U1E97_11755 [Alphaproteobacteria bacterium]
MALRALGFDNDALRIVVLRDLNLQLAHAILVVYYEDRVLVLDNQISDIVEATAIRHYRPIYSVSRSASLAAPAMTGGVAGPARRASVR